MVSGKVTDGAAPTPNAVTGISVRFYRTAVGDTTGAFVEAARSDLAGNYRLWVRPGDYAVRVRGQIANPTVVAFSANNTPAAVDFGAAVGRVTATLHAPGGQPLSQVKVNVYDDTANAVFESFEITNGDGTVELYAEPTGTYRIEYKVDNGSTTVGSAIHNGTSPTGTQLLQGTLVTFDTAAAPNALGTITLPAGGELKGVVTTVAPLQPGNIVVQVRSGGTNGNFRFTATRTQKDGSYSISVPAGTYNRVCAFVPGTAAACGAQPSLAGTYASADAVVVVAGQSNTLDIAIP
jgi:hypothetical protein